MFSKLFIDNFSFNESTSKAQGTIEYLVIVSVVIVLALVVTGLVITIFSNQDISGKVNSLPKVSSEGLSVSDSVMDLTGTGLLEIKSINPEGLTITSIKEVSSGVVAEYNEPFFSGSTKNFSVKEFSGDCVCGPNDTVKTCEIEITFTSAYGLIKTENLAQEINCVENVSAQDSSNVVGRLNNQAYLDFLVGNKELAQSNNAHDFVYGMGLDSLGNVYVGGEYYGDLNFGNGIYLSGKDGDVNTISDFFIAKYDSSGNIVWAKTNVSSENRNDAIYTMFIDSSDNLWVGGAYNGILDFGGGFTLPDVDGTIYASFFVAKYNSDGELLKVFGPVSSGGRTTSIGNLFVDSVGSIYISGSYYGTIDFNGGVTLADMDGAGGTSSFFIAKYDSNGEIIWAKSKASVSAGTSNARLAVDNLGNIYLGGSYTHDLNLGGSFYLSNMGDNLKVDSFIAKYDSDGNVLWLKGIETPSVNYANTIYTIFVTPTSDVYVGGYHVADLNFGANAYLSNIDGDVAKPDFFILKLNSNGVSEFAIGAYAETIAGNDIVGSIFVDSQENIYASGYYAGDLNFGNGLYLPDQVSNNFFVVKYNSLKNPIWVLSSKNSLSNATNTISGGMFVDSQKNVSIAGQYSGDLNLGESYLTDFDPNNKSNFFIAKYYQE